MSLCQNLKGFRRIFFFLIRECPAWRGMARRRAAARFFRLHTYRLAAASRVFCFLFKTEGRSCRRDFSVRRMLLGSIITNVPLFHTPDRSSARTLPVGDARSFMHTCPMPYVTGGSPPSTAVCFLLLVSKGLCVFNSNQFNSIQFNFSLAVIERRSFVLPPCCLSGYLISGYLISVGLFSFFFFPEGHPGKRAIPRGQGYSSRDLQRDRDAGMIRYIHLSRRLAGRSMAGWLAGLCSAMHFSSLLSFAHTDVAQSSICRIGGGRLSVCVSIDRFFFYGVGG